MLVLAILAVVLIISAFIVDIALGEMIGRSPVMVVLNWVWTVLVVSGLGCMVAVFIMWMTRD